MTQPAKLMGEGPIYVGKQVVGKRVCKNSAWPKLLKLIYLLQSSPNYKLTYKLNFQKFKDYVQGIS